MRGLGVSPLLEGCLENLNMQGGDTGASAARWGQDSKFPTLQPSRAGWVHSGSSGWARGTAGSDSGLRRHQVGNLICTFFHHLDGQPDAGSRKEPPPVHLTGVLTL